VFQARFSVRIFSYFQKGHTLKGEAHYNLDTIHRLRTTYFNKYNTYIWDDATAGRVYQFFSQWAYEEKTLYSYYCDHEIIPATAFLKEKALIHDPETNWPDGVVKPKSSQNSFTCVAIGDIDNDDTFDAWSINDGNSPSAQYRYLIIEANHEVDDTGDDGTRTRGNITFEGRVYLRTPDGGIYFYLLGMLTPLLLLSIAVDIARAVRLRREVGGGD